MKKKKDSTVSLSKDELQKQLKRKDSAVERMKRELKIEAALEKVRARTMAMQKSDELLDAAIILFQQIKSLGAQTGSCGFNIWEKDEKAATAWMSSAEGALQAPFKMPHTKSAIYKEVYEAMKNGEDFLVKEVGGKTLEKHFDYLLTVPGIGDVIKHLRETGYVFPETMVYHFAFFNNGYLSFHLHQHHPDTHNIFKRFAKVFEQTYTRFLDLQKAEAQAREAQIELSLERVRAKTMAMHNSQHVADTVAALFDELVKLGIDKTTRSGVAIIGEKDDMEIWTASSHVNGEIGLDIGRVDLNIHPLIEGFRDAWRSKKPDYFYELIGEDLIDYFKAINASSDYPTQFDLASLPSKQIHSSFFFPEGAIYAFSLEPLTAEVSKIFKRFAGVFGQTYRRYLDLKKAEAQAREAQIEAALERVRTRTMAMHRGDELADASTVFFEQLSILGVKPRSCGFLIMHEDSELIEDWSSNADEHGNAFLISGTFTFNQHPMIDQVVAAWRRHDPYFIGELHGDDLQKYYEAVTSTITSSREIKDKVLAIATSEYTNSFYFEYGMMYVLTPAPLPEHERNVILRFAGVFKLTYRRFLDLQKAEAQAREAQIEAALERVRSRTMAMFKSDELAETAAILIGQLNVLGIEPISLYIGIIKDNRGDMEIWSTDENGKEIDRRYLVNINKNSSIKKIYDVWKAKEKFIALDMEGKELEDWLAYWKVEHHLHFKSGQSLHRRVQNIAYFSQGFIAFTSSDKQPPSTINLLERFANVFNLTYTRFTDLQKAEAQAREAKIEASLERVRSKAMAMHSSKDLADTIIAFYRELESLSVTPRRCGVGLINKETHIAEISSMNTTEQGDSIAVIGNLDLKVHPILRGIYDNWLLQKDYYPVLRGSEIKEYYQILTPQIDYPDYPHDVIQYGYFFFFAEGGVYAWTEKQMTENELKIYHRFTSVLTLTYKRYKDLKQAEEQAREATIEAALERVRGKAMAMRNSEDLSSAASMVFTELRKLGINPIRSGVGIISKESRQVQFYSAMSSANGDSLSLTGGVVMSGHPEFEKQYESWLRKENYFVALKGEELKSYYKFLFAGLNIDSEINIEDDQEQYGHWLMFSEGFLFAWSDKAYSETEINILERFKKIVELTFRRYMELQKSESNAKEAVKQAALDRVRAEIASMRTPKDLERITPLIWNELTVLGIPFIRCGVFIMDDSQELIHTFLSTPDGKAIAAFHIPYDTPGNINQVLDHWQQKENYIDHWDEKAFIDFAHTLVKQGALASPEQYLHTIPHGGFHLHFLPFLQGMLYVGNSNRLGDEEIKLIQSVADAFSTAYARYEDFNKLEAAKQQVDKTLVDLKQAQTQLIQSEKMASLGELTAGIAHEIQNPLNFVNNFSEVNTELIEEMEEEIRNGNIEEVKAIVNDIKENEQKINHHGKRADAIVKGMLQHSRSSSGQKESTDINVLTDEYVRLCFHGLRAKDKSFNAAIKTDFDHAIEKINIIPQDIGRVILNLLTNAFYAVNEKRKAEGAGYEPTVSVSTKKSENQVSITVSDNGNGIPQKIVDKIFQPFFTTKPTGQGTGLGLSLSYDIIKAHGGEIKVETKEGEGTAFIIQLPVA